MKTQKFKILSLRMALLTILLSGLSMQNIYAFSETTKNLPLNGRWERDSQCRWIGNRKKRWGSGQ